MNCFESKFWLQVLLSVQGGGQYEALRGVVLCSDEQAICGDCLSITKFDQVAHSQILAADLPLTGAPILPIGRFYARVHPCICALVFPPSPQVGEPLSEHAEEDHEDQGHDRGKRVVRTDRWGALEDRVDHIEDICHAEELDEAGHGKKCKTIDKFKKNPAYML